MMPVIEATNPGENNHATQSQVVCDSSRFTANSIKMPNDQRIDRSVTKVKSLLDVQEGQLVESLDVPSQCSAVSACVGNSSGNLAFDELENTKSELIPNHTLEVKSNDSIFDVTEENDEEGIWSILTDNLHYLEVKPSLDSNSVRFQNSEMRTSIAKKRFFNADNNNVPEKEFYLEHRHR